MFLSCTYNLTDQISLCVDNIHFAAHSNTSKLYLQTLVVMKKKHMVPAALAGDVNFDVFQTHLREKGGFDVFI